MRKLAQLGAEWWYYGWRSDKQSGELVGVEGRRRAGSVLRHNRWWEVSVLRMRAH